MTPHPKLDARLEAAMDLVRPGSTVADVGADHGYLVCALVGGGKCPRGYASDINPQPLEAARRHIRELGLESRIKIVLSDGLRELPGGKIDDVVIAGMGGELIAEILFAVNWTRSPDKHYILQPMTRAAHLRRRLLREGFSILRERAVKSGRFVYTVLSVKWSGVPTVADPLFAETGLLLQQRDAPALEYLARLRYRLLKEAEGLAKSAGHAEAAARCRAIAARITEQIGGSPFE